MGPLFKERFISITVAEFSKGGRRFKHTSDCLHLSAAKYFSDIFILVIIKLYTHSTNLDLHARLCYIKKRNQGTFLGTINANQEENRFLCVQLYKHGIV